MYLAAVRICNGAEFIFSLVWKGKSFGNEFSAIIRSWFTAKNIAVRHFYIYLSSWMRTHTYLSVKHITKDIAMLKQIDFLLLHDFCVIVLKTLWDHFERCNWKSFYVFKISKQIDIVSRLISNLVTHFQ